MAEFVDDIEPLVTRCPECGTRFRVTESQLQVAGGRVRCGSCLTVFFGTDHLQWDLEVASAEADPDATLDQLLREIDVFEARDTGNVDAELVPPEPMSVADVDGTTPSEPDVALRADNHDESVVETWQAEIDTEIHTEIQADDPLPEPEVVEFDEPVDMVEVVDEADDQTVEAREEPEPSSTVDDDEPTSSPDRFTELWRHEEPDADEDAHDADQMVARTPEAAASLPAHADTGSASSKTLKQSPALDPEDILDPLTPAAETPRSRRWLRVAVIPVAIVLLALQGAWYFFPGWAADPQMRWLPERICGVVGCTLEPLRDLEQLLITDVVVRGHPEEAKQRIVNLLMVNTAGFDQAFPDIEIAFRSPTGDLVAWKRFKPADYLNGALLSGMIIPAKTPVRVELGIEDPGTQSYGYEISLK